MLYRRKGWSAVEAFRFTEDMTQWPEWLKAAWNTPAAAHCALVRNGAGWTFISGDGYESEPIKPGDILVSNGCEILEMSEEKFRENYEEAR